MRYITPVLVLLVFPGALHAQITRGNYYSYLPAMPKLVTQTAASEALHLYGDESNARYADGDGNGIDDRRQAQLLRIADRFSPILRRNNFSFPRDFKRVLGERDLLYVDTWAAGRLANSQEIRLGWSTKEKGNDAAAVDEALRAIVAEIDPTKTDTRSIRPEVYEEKVFFVDFPGDGPVSWRKAYRGADQKEATLYTHFFIHQDTAARDQPRYYLVAQHWFFYPFDDAANNHEGDWEHMNVLISTRAAAQTNERSSLTEAELQAILDGDESQVQSLVIGYIDYYFHENVFTVSYLPNYQPAADDPHKIPLLKRLTVWRDTGYVNRTVAERLSTGGGVLASHPIGYIGGDNKGPDELLSPWPRFVEAYNRNGHGTYAFPGTWQSVGAMASTEQIHGKAVAALRRGISRTAPLHELIADSMFVTFATQNIVVVPDWERVNTLFAQNPRSLRDWNWLVLPMRWGFPASASPGAGAVAHTDVGNISPEGPAFQPTWNRVGSAAGWRDYQADVLRVMLAPTTPFDKLKSGWGFLNVPVALFGFLPGWNVAVTQLMPWVTGTLHVVGAPPPRTFKPADVNFRFSSMTGGWTRQMGGRDFARMLPVPPNASSDSTSVSDLTQRSGTAQRFGLQLYYGKRLSIENTFAMADRALSATHKHQDGRIERLDGNITTGDLTGGARYDVGQPANGDVHLYLRGGWGWTWYNVRTVAINGIAREDSLTKKGGYIVSLLPTRRWWPNSWYGGAGVEYFAPQSLWLLPQFGYGIRADVTASRHRLGATNPGQQILGIASRYELGISAVLGW